MCITVIAFTDQYCRRFGPLGKRIDADKLSAGNESCKLFSAEQVDQVFVQPSASVIAGINDDRFAVTVTS